MKISKVKHTRAGVVEKNKIQGILYKTPSNTEQNLKERVSELNEKASKLYKVFTGKDYLMVVLDNYEDNKKNKEENKKNKNEVNEFIKSIDEILESVIDEIRKKKELTAENVVNRIVSCYKDKKSSMNSSKIRKQCEKLDKTIEDFASFQVDRNCRRSLSRSEVPNILKKLIISILYERENIISVEDGKELLSVLKKDILKKKQLEQIVKSIENQNVKVQPFVNEKGECLLALSNHNKPKKQYIFDFIVEYANADDERQNTMLVEMRKLIILFVCGKKTYEDADSFGVDAWTYSIEKDAIKGEFCNGLSLKFEKLDSLKSDVSNRKKNKQEILKIEKEIRSIIDSMLTTAYREAKEVVDEKYLFWIGYIQAEVKKILMPKGKLSARYKVMNKYLCKRVCDNWISFIAEKYIDMGKGVYNFVLPSTKDLKDTSKELSIKEVRDEYKNGITSFDYEYIKAEESLNKNMSVVVTIAVNNFSRAIKIKDDSMIDDCNLKDRDKANKDDVLAYNKPDMFKVYCDIENCKRNILQYFGGISKCYKKIDINRLKDFKFFEVFKNSLNNIRNASFHFAAETNNDNGVSELVKSLCEMEVNDYSRIVREKYYSNNAYIYYKESDLIPLLNDLYSKVKERPAQIPAFNRILTNDNIDSFLSDAKIGVIDRQCYRNVTNDKENKSKYQSLMRFLLKEIYYNSFICHEKCIVWVYKAVKLAGKNLQGDERYIYKNFSDRFDEIMKEKNISFGQACQQIMTDMQIQNNAIHTVEKNKEDVKFKQYREYLHKVIYEAFSWYLNKVYNLFDKIAHPTLMINATSDVIKKESFLESCKFNRYDFLLDMIEKNNDLASWYVASHFISPRQINLFIGDIRNYISFTEDICRRKNKVTKKEDNHVNQIKLCKDLLSVLEIVLISSGHVIQEVGDNKINCIEDYFDDEEDYAKYLFNYVDFEDKTMQQTERPFRTMLFNFTNNREGTGENNIIDIYTDAENIKINRNIILSKLYGINVVDDGWYNKISFEEIKDYYALKNKLCFPQKNSDKAVFKKLKCEYPEEQKCLIEFQQLKNRVELMDITIYSDIIMDMYSQLITWSYMRERDLLYMQLGVAYLALYHGEKRYKKDDIFSDKRLNVLSGDINIKEGAILYQLTAINTSTLDMYRVVEGSAQKIKDISKTIGGRNTKFTDEYLNGTNMKNESEMIYNNALCFFENVNMHDYIIKKLRNYIDHFKFLAKSDRSILELYSEVYSYYFTYSRKLQKSVSFSLLNVLERYFVMTKLEMKGIKKKITYDNKKDKEKTVKRVDFKHGILDAIKMNYKNIKYEDKYKNYFIKDKDKTYFQLNGRSDNFLTQLEKLLDYKKTGDNK